jgi:hypothetical protein
LVFFIFYFFLWSYILHTYRTRMDFLKNCQESPATVCVYFGLVLLLLVLCVFHLNKLTAAKEHYTGVGLGHGGGYAGAVSGASMRTLAQEFSGTNQQDRSIISNAEIAQLDPTLSEVGRPVDIFAAAVAAAKQEDLVNGRGEPDFWEIGSELSAYKTSQVRPMTAEAKAKAEYFRGREHLPGELGLLEDDRLGMLLNQ